MTMREVEMRFNSGLGVNDETVYIPNLDGTSRPISSKSYYEMLRYASEN